MASLTVGEPATMSQRYREDLEYRAAVLAEIMRIDETLETHDDKTRAEFLNDEANKDHYPEVLSHISRLQRQCKSDQIAA